ncbi:MAG: ATP-binding protein [Bacilli bacterium]|nr:ATP-binding protein [Bacilli bacterium]MDD4808706.1 ATP-binding protein [Bacilli bacterium]
MLGTIIGTEENDVLIRINVSLNEVPNLVNYHIIMEDEDKKIVAEITNVTDGIAKANLLGEIIDDRFVFGVIRKPSFSSSVKIISKEKIPMIIGIDNYREDKHLYLGESPLYQGVKLGVDVNDFFSNHFAIFGSTGSGKSCSVARIFQNLFEKSSSVPYKASIFIFDAYGEYHNAFKDLGKKVPEISMKTYTTNTYFNNTDLMKIPLWLLGVDDIALLLGAESPSQIPIIEKALKLVTIFAREEDNVIAHKNDIIARALLDILSSGRPPAQIRDQVFSVLTYYNTTELNLDTPVYQPGYTRPLKQCLLIDASGKIRDMELLTTFIESFLADNLELVLPDGTFTYSLEDLKHAMDFALISEGILKSDKVYDDTNVLKVRLHSLINSSYNVYFNYPKYVSKEQYIKQLMTSIDGKKAQIINFNINYVDDRFAKVVVKIYSKLLFDYTKERNERGTMPIHIILEEAHRYVQNDNDINLLGYNIFERITKEGRKYGILLGLISQRPSELSETAISQCSNFLIFKMLHPKDINYIREMTPNITDDTTKKLKVLQPGTCVAFGLAFKVPIIIKLAMPDPAPSSNSSDISANWFIQRS